MKKYISILAALLMAAHSIAQTPQQRVDQLRTASNMNISVQKKTVDALQTIVDNLGGGGTWGSITGTLSNQTDLQAALDLKANLASPTFTGVPIVPNQPANSNDGRAINALYCDSKNLTIGTGLTNTAGTLSADLSTGKSGGQSVIGGTASGNSLTISSTSHATKGSILFGTSSYSEAANTLALVFGGPGSSATGIWTGTAAGQNSWLVSATITGRTNAAGGGSDDYNTAHISTTSTTGSGAGSQVFRGLLIDGSYGTGSGQEALTINPTFTGSGANSYLLRARSASTDRFTVTYAGDISATGSGIHTFTAPTRLTTITPELRTQSSAGSADLLIFDTNANVYYRLRSSGSAFTINENGTRLLLTANATNNLLLAAGSTTVAPLGFTSASLLSSPVAGKVEFLTDDLYFTQTTSALRYRLLKGLPGSATLDFASTAAGAATDLTITVTGAADGDPVVVGPVNASVPNNGDFTAWVSATNTVTVRFTNNDLTNAKDPASGTFKVTVIKQ